MNLLGRLRKHLTYANVGVTLCLFVLLGGGAYAAAKLGKDTVKSKQIKDGQVKTDDLADGAVNAAKIAPGALREQTIQDGSITGSKLADGSVTGAKVADDSLSGADVDEATLQGVNVSKVGGVDIKKINFQVPVGTNTQSVLTFPGVFRIDAQCQNFGDALDIAAFTARDNSKISVTAVDATDADDRPNNFELDVVSRTDSDFDSNEGFEVDVTSELAEPYPRSSLTVQFATPDGFVATTDLQAIFDGTGVCTLTGTSIGG